MENETNEVTNETIETTTTSEDVTEETTKKANVFKFENGYKDNVIFVTITFKPTGERVEYLRAVEGLDAFTGLLASHGAKQKICDKSAMPEGTKPEERLQAFQTMIEQLDKEVWTQRKVSKFVKLSKEEIEETKAGLTEEELAIARKFGL